MNIEKREIDKTIKEKEELEKRLKLKKRNVRKGN